MYALACCNSEGRCFGFLNKANIVETNEKLINDERWVEKNLLTFKKKSEAHERALQINLGHDLLPNGSPYRVAVVKA